MAHEMFSKGTLAGPRPRGLMRTLMRLPIWMYRFGLGWLLGDRFVMLTHIGRKSGLPRDTVVEIVLRDTANDVYIVASGWGTRADWFRNIQKTPRVLLHDGRRRREAVAMRVPEGDAYVILRDYARRHPEAFRNLARLMLGRQLDSTESAYAELARHVPLVALRPNNPGVS